MLLTTVPVSRISSFGLLNRMSETGAATGQRTWTETPRADSEWLRRIYGAGFWVNPFSRVPEVQWEVIRRFLAVSATGSFI